MSADHGRGSVRRGTLPATIQVIAPAERDHLKERFDGKRNEWFCIICRSSVTVSPDGRREYGHEHTYHSNGSDRPCAVLYGNNARNDRGE